jgi:hypothetical protein
MKNILNGLTAFIAAFILVACGGGGGGSGTPAASTLGGVAAVGSPIVNGTINVNCAAGSALAPVTTNTTGGWTVTLSGQTLPCAVEVSGGTIGVGGAGNAISYHSIAIASGTVNVTPLTDLIVVSVAGAATPGTWFAGLNASPSQLASITQTKVNTAITNVNTALNGLAPLSASNPLTTSFTPTAGNVNDDMLTALQTAMASTGVAYATLLSDASLPTFTAPTGFGTALSTAYAGTTSGTPAPTATSTPATGFPIAFNGVSMDSLSFKTASPTGVSYCNATLSYHSTSTSPQIGILDFNIIEGGVVVGQTAFASTGMSANATGQYTNLIAVNSTLPACGTFTLQFNPTSSSVTVL